jgi:hypothetical protein
VNLLQNLAVLLSLQGAQRRSNLVGSWREDYFAGSVVHFLGL